MFYSRLRPKTANEPAGDAVWVELIVMINPMSPRNQTISATTKKRSDCSFTGFYQEIFVSFPVKKSLAYGSQGRVPDANDAEVIYGYKIKKSESVYGRVQSTYNAFKGLR